MKTKKRSKLILGIDTFIFWGIIVIATGTIVGTFLIQYGARLSRITDNVDSQEALIGQIKELDDTHKFKA